MVTARRHLKIPTVLANKFRRKKHFTTSDWLSGYPICHLLGHAPSIKTASGTHIFADMNVVKDFISTSKNFHLWQQEKRQSRQATFPFNPLLIHTPYTSRVDTWETLVLKCCPLQRLAHGPKCRKQVFSRFVSLLVSQFLELLVPHDNLQGGQILLRWNPSQIIHPSTEHTNDSLTGSQVWKPQYPTDVMKVL